MRSANEKQSLEKLDHDDKIKWYEKKEPKTQIEILKKIATEGCCSTGDLVKSFNKSFVAINPIIVKMRSAEHPFIQSAFERKVDKSNNTENVYSLTDFGIRVLLESYHKNEEDVEPYLNPDEFLEFYERYSDDYSKLETIRKHSDGKQTDGIIILDNWKRPKITKEQLLEIYEKHFPHLAKEVKCKLSNSEFTKDVLEYREKISKIQSVKNKMSNLEKQLHQYLYELHQFEKNSSDKKKHK